MPYVDADAKRAHGRVYTKTYKAKQRKAAAKDPALRERLLQRQRIYKAEFDRRQRERKARAANPFCNAMAKAIACQWRLHKLAPDGDLLALKERLREECKQWST